MNFAFNVHWRLARSLCCLAIALGCADIARAGTVRNSTQLAYYDVYGMTYAELLLSVQENAPRVDGAIALALLETALDMQPVPARPGGCKLKDVSFHVRHRMVLPRLLRPRTIPTPVRQQFDAFQIAVRKHEEEHRSIYLNCIKRMRRLLLNLPAAPSCRRYEKDVSDVIKFARAECHAENIAIDRRDSSQVERFPLVRHALQDVAQGRVPPSLHEQLIASSKATRHFRSIDTITIERNRSR